MPPSPLPKSAATAPPQLLAQALALHAQSRLAEAERLYAEILAARPNHFEALQMMGMIKLAKGEPAEALRLVSAAMRTRAASPQILLNHGLILNALGRSEEALASFDHAIKLKSKYAEAHNNRAAVLAALGRHDEALESYTKATVIKPDYAEAHYNRASLLRTLARHEEALKGFDRALALRPKYLKAHNNRGAALEELGRSEEALAAFERALALDPNFAEARTNRSRLLGVLGRYDEALASFAQGLAAEPNNAELHCQRGRLLLELNRNDEACADFEKALALKPGYADAAFGACIGELPIVYREEGEIARRRAAYEARLRALAVEAEAGRLKGDLMKAIAVRQPFLLAYQGGDDRALQSLYGAMIRGIVARQFPDAALPPPPAPGEPIRVGIVSAFFNRHSNWKIPIKGWLSQFDRSRFKLYGYHLVLKRDEETAAAEKMCARFVNAALDVAGWRREILADRPHVLIYPGLLMDNTSLQLAAQRLAPVQMNSWGHPETSGLSTLDYFLSSDLMEPHGAEALYTEKLVRLPNLSFHYEPPRASQAVMTRTELGLRENATAYWCGQSVYKYLPQYDDVFARIAEQAGNVQFVFLRHQGGPLVNEIFQERLTRAFAARGLNAADHCIHHGRLGQAQFVAAMGLCDVFLDSIGWSGCNSAMESLPNDLPIVTTPGAYMRGRHSAAILEMMGLGDTVAPDVDAYVETAVRLAKSPEERQALRRRMADNKHKLFNDRACVTALEELLEGAVRARQN
ncbi:MAG: tetratricopeptide repeat protein [Pseudolabrys sp.]